MVGGRAEGWGSDFQSREGWRVGEAGAEITNRCDSSDKRSNLDKSQALALVGRLRPLSSICLFSILSLSQGRGRGGEGTQRGEEMGGGRAARGANFIFRDFGFSF